MKIFLKNAAIFFLILACIYSTLYFTIPRIFYSTDDYQLHSSIHRHLAADGINGNVLIGDSKSQMGLNAKCIHATNFSFGGVGPIEGYYELKKLLENKHDHIDTLFLSYGLRHLISQDFFYKSTYYYNFISSSYLDSARRIAAQYNDGNYALKNSAFSGTLDIILDDPATSAKILVLKEFLLGGLNGLYEHFERMVDHKMFNGDNQFANGRLVIYPYDTVKFIRTKSTELHDEDLIHAKASEVDMIYLQKILALSHAHNIKVLFVFMPWVNSAATPAIEKEIVQLHTVFGNDLICDTSAYNDSLFRDDVGHLNLTGVGRFQRFLVNRLYTNDSVRSNF